MNTRKQGDVGLGAAIAYFTSIGRSVALPLTESQRYDLIVDEDGKLCKVEVKRTTQKKPNGSYVATIKTCGGNRSGTGKARRFDGSAVDYLFVLADDGTRWLFPGSEVKAGSALVLGPDKDRFLV